MRPIPSETRALLALRRSVLQLAVLGTAIALVLPWIAPGLGTLALWFALAPLSACAANCRTLPAAILVGPVVRAAGRDVVEAPRMAARIGALAPSPRACSGIYCRP